MAASWFDLLTRLEVGLYADDRLHTEAAYRSALPGWLAEAAATVARNAHERYPVLVVNCKGRPVADALVILRLVDFEELAGCALLAGASAEELAILAPDRAG